MIGRIFNFFKANILWKFSKGWRRE